MSHLRNIDIKFISNVPIHRHKRHNSNQIEIIVIDTVSPIKLCANYDKTPAVNNCISHKAGDTVL